MTVPDKPRSIRACLTLPPPVIFPLLGRYNEEGLFRWTEGQGREGFPGGVLRSREGAVAFAFLLSVFPPGSHPRLSSVSWASRGGESWF